MSGAHSRRKGAAFERELVHRFREVMPDAEVRVFLEADAAARERRRAAEGMQDPIGNRDRMDSTRAVSPMVCPPGAVRIDNTELGLDAVVDRVAALVAAAAGR